MKVRDLSKSVAQLTRPLVVLDDLVAPYDFRELQSGARFSQLFDATHLPTTDGIVLVGDAAQNATHVTSNAPEGTIVQAWFPLGLGCGTAQLTELVGGTDPSIVMVALSTEERWVKVQLEPGDGGRPVEDLLAGLRLGHAIASADLIEALAASADRVEPRLDVPETCLRAEIVARLVRRGKPLKRFLPSVVVRAVYKMIGVLR